MSCQEISLTGINPVAIVDKPLIIKAIAINTEPFMFGIIIKDPAVILPKMLANPIADTSHIAFSSSIPAKYARSVMNVIGMIPPKMYSNPFSKRSKNV